MTRAEEFQHAFKYWEARIEKAKAIVDDADFDAAALACCFAATAHLEQVENQAESPLNQVLKMLEDEKENLATARQGHANIGRMVEAEMPRMGMK